MTHPLTQLSRPARARMLTWTVLLTIALMAALQRVGAPLENHAAPFGIVSFELAKTVFAAGGILASWDETARLYAAFGLGLDYLFLIAYSTSLALGCLWAGEVLGVRGNGLAQLAPWLAWGQWLAALLDALENAALLVVLIGPAASPWPWIAWACAVPKFVLIAAGLLYLPLGIFVALTARRERSPG